MKIAIHHKLGSFSDRWIDYCKENNIQTVGAGKNKEEAKKVFYIDSPEGKIGIINIAENEWSSATDTSAGANGMDLIDDVKAIQKAKEESDFVFVIVHGGHEYYNLPNPRMQKQYRFYAEQGADIVVGHHTHCISGNEVHKGVPIYYSLGNFLFTKPSRYDDWYKGIVLQIEINDKKEIKTKEIFVEQSNENFGVSLIEKDELKIIKKRFNGYSKMIDSKEELLKEWNEYTDLKKIQYKKWWSPLTFLNFRFFKALLIRTNILLFNKHGAKLYLNLIRCESHSDLSKAFMKKYLSDK